MTGPMPTTFQPLGICTLLILCAACLELAQPAAHAKLGESFPAYKAKIIKNWTQTAQDSVGPKTNYRFTLIISPQQQNASQGYAAGLTITVADGKIVGQSVAIRPGMNQVVGAAMATAHGFAFAYEAIGKPIPQEKAKSEAEFNAFSQAVGQAFMGKAQNIRYPGCSGLITVTRDNLGDLIIAATPASPVSSPPGKH